MRETGKMTCRMGSGWNPGEMGQNMKGTTKKGRNMEKVRIY